MIMYPSQENDHVVSTILSSFQLFGRRFILCGPSSKILQIEMWTPHSTFLLNFYTHMHVHVGTLTLIDISEEKVVACSCALASLIDAYW